MSNMDHMSICQVEGLTYAQLCVESVLCANGIVASQNNRARCKLHLANFDSEQKRDQKAISEE